MPNIPGGFEVRGIAGGLQTTPATVVSSETVQLPTGQMISGYSFGEIVSLPTRVKTLEASVSQNWTDHNGMKKSINWFSSQWFNQQVSLNDLISRVSGLEAGKAVPGGGAAGLTGAQTNDLAWLNKNRTNLAGLLNLPVSDINTDILNFMSQKDFQDKFQNLFSGFAGDPASVTRYALYNFNGVWWQNLDLSGKVNSKYLRSVLDNSYVDWENFNGIKGSIYNDPNVGLNVLSRGLNTATDNVTRLTNRVDSLSSRADNVRAVMICLKTQLDKFRVDTDMFKQNLQAWSRDMATGGDDGIRPGHIGTAVQDVGAGLAQWSDSFKNDVVPQVQKMVDDLVATVKCITDVIANL